MALPFAAMGMGIGSMIGGFLNQRSQNQIIRDQLNYRNGAANNLYSAAQGNTMPSGAAWNVYGSALDPLQQYAGGMLGGDWAPDFYRQNLMMQQGQLGNYYGMLPGMTQGQGAMNDPFFSGMYSPWMEQTNARYNNGLDVGMGLFNSQGYTPENQNLIDYASMFMQGGSPYMQGPMDIGNYLLSTGGNYAGNQGAMDRAFDNLNSGGWDARTGGMFDFGGATMQNPYDDFTSQLFSGGVQGRDRFANQDPEAFIGARGSSALNSLANSPFIGQNFNNFTDLLRQGTQNGGYTPQDSMAFGQAMPRFFDSIDQSNGQMNQAWSRAMGASNTDRDALPSWFQGIAGLAGPLFNQGGGNAIDISNVGGGGGAGAGAMSRDLGPQDAEITRIMQQAMDEWNKNPIMSEQETISRGRDLSATAANQRAEQARRAALRLGGGGPLSSGTQNNALADYADEAMQNESSTISRMLMERQGLGVQRDAQATQLTNAATQARLQREGMFARMNEADAQNQTQASIANASSADRGADRSLQAQIANANLAQSRNQLMAQVMGQLMGNATEMRGQNNQERLAGLNLLPSLQNAMTQRQGLLGDSMNQAGNRANQRFGGSLGLANSLNDTANSDTNRWNAIINPLVAGQNTGTQRAGLYNNAALGAIGSGDNRFNTGASLMGNATNAANNRFANASNLFNSADQSQLARMTLGGNLNNSMLNTMLGFGGLNANAQNNRATQGLNAGNLGLNFANSQNGMFNAAGNLYSQLQNNQLGRDQFGANAYNQFFTTQQNQWNPYFQGTNQATGIYGQIMQGAQGYMNNGLGLYGQYANMFNQPNTSQYGSAWGSLAGGLGALGGQALGGMFGGGGGSGPSPSNAGTWWNGPV